jgi:HSP20 family protein
MLALSRSVFSDFFPLQNAIEDFFNGSLSLEQSVSPASFDVPEVEVYSKNGNLVYRLAAPGVDPKDVDLSVKDHRVSLKIERKSTADVKEGDWHVKGFSYGEYRHSWVLPQDVETEKLNATFTNGVLEITVPVSQKALPRKIELKALKS